MRASTSRHRHQLRTIGLIGSLLLLAAPGLAIAKSAKAQAKEDFDQMKASQPQVTDPHTIAVVECVTYSLIAALTGPEAQLDWELAVIDAPDTVNAAAMAGGKIMVFNGLFKIADTQDMLAAVLGHELTHATHNHNEGKIWRNRLARLGATAAGIAGAMVGGTSTATAAQDAVTLGAGLGGIRMDKAKETTADVVGLHLMARAGFDPRATVDFWQRLSKESLAGGVPEFLNDHPSDVDRINRLVQELPEAIKEQAAARAAGRDPQCG